MEDIMKYLRSWLIYNFDNASITLIAIMFQIDTEDKANKAELLKTY